MSTAQQELRTIFTANIADLQKGLATATSGVESFARVGTEAFGLLSKAAIALSIAFSFKEAINQFADFETAINKVRQELGQAREGELKGFEQGLKEIATATGTALPELASGLKEIVSSGLDAGKEIKSLATINKLSTIASEDLGTAIKAVDAVTKNFGKSAGTTSEIADKLFVITREGRTSLGELNTFFSRTSILAQQTGVKFEELGGVIAFMTQQHIAARQSMVSLQDILGAVAGITDQQAKTFKALGIELDKNSIKNLGLAQTMELLSRLSVEQQKQLGLEKNGISLLGKVHENLQDEIKKTQAVYQAVGTNQREFTIQQTTLAAEMKKLKEAGRILAIEGITPLVPAIKDIALEITRGINSYKSFIIANQDSLTAINNLVRDGMVNAKPTMNAFADIIRDINENLIAGVPALVDWTVNFGKAIDKFASNTQAVSSNPFITAVSDLLQLSGVAKNLEGAVGKSIEKFFEWNIVTAESRREQKGLKVDVVSVSDVLMDYTKEMDGNIQKSIALAQSESEVATKKKETAKATEEETVSLDKDTLKKRENKKILDELAQAYRILSEQFRTGRINQAQFAQGINDLYTKGLKLKQSIEGIASAINSVKDSKITVDLIVNGDDQVIALKERVLQSQEDIVLARATGEEKNRLQIQITGDRAIRALKAEYDEFVRLQQIKLDGLIAQKTAIEKSVETQTGLKGKALEDEQRLQTQDLRIQIAGEQGKAEQIKKSYTQLIKDKIDTTNLSIKLADEEIKKNQEVTNSIDDQTRAVQKLQSVKTNSPYSGFNAPSKFSLGSNQATIGSSVQTVQQFGNAVLKSLSSVTASAPRSLYSGYTPSTQTGTGGFLSSSPTIAGYAEGTDYVPKTGIYSLHQGEAVLTKKENETRQAGGVVQQTTIVNLIDPAMIPQILAQYPNAVLNIVNSDILRNGTTRRVIRSTR